MARIGSGRLVRRTWGKVRSTVGRVANRGRRIGRKVPVVRRLVR